MLLYLPLLPPPQPGSIHRPPSESKLPLGFILNLLNCETIHEDSFYLQGSYEAQIIAACYNFSGWEFWSSFQFFLRTCYKSCFKVLSIYQSYILKELLISIWLSRYLICHWMNNDEDCTRLLTHELSCGATLFLQYKFPQVSKPFHIKLRVTEVWYGNMSFALPPVYTSPT